VPRALTRTRKTKTQLHRRCGVERSGSALRKGSAPARSPHLSRVTFLSGARRDISNRRRQHEQATLWTSKRPPALLARAYGARTNRSILARCVSVPPFVTNADRTPRRFSISIVSRAPGKKSVSSSRRTANRPANASEITCSRAAGMPKRAVLCRTGSDQNAASAASNRSATASGVKGFSSSSNSRATCKRTRGRPLPSGSCGPVRIGWRAADQVFGSL